MGGFLGTSSTSRYGQFSVWPPGGLSVIPDAGGRGWGEGRPANPIPALARGPGRVVSTLARCEYLHKVRLYPADDQRWQKCNNNKYLARGPITTSVGAGHYKPASTPSLISSRVFTPRLSGKASPREFAMEILFYCIVFTDFTS